ncbi:MAG: MmgE/PrpD family protein [Haloferacaceae archaeon]
MDETAALAADVAETAYGDVPDDAVARAKTAIRDFAGLALHGSGHATGRTVGAYLDAAGTGGGATVVGRGRADPPRAAFANGAFGHVLNYDDTFESVVVHPTCTAFPAAFAAAEAADATGRDLLVGYVVGCDAAYRVGRSVAPSHWLRGWHATATVGVFGATAAAASVLGLSAERTRHAFGVAASFSSGLKRNIGTRTNPVHCGHAAGKGVEAALLAREGIDADDAVLGGEYGFGELATDAGGYDPGEITDPDVEWAVRDLAFKPYPSGVVTHSAMEALRAILEREDLAPEDVATVTATVDEGVTDTIDQHDPRTATEATVSYEFCLAAVLRERDPGLDEFTDEYVRAAATRAAMDKVRLDPRVDPFGGSAAEASYGARVAVETTDGRTFTEEVLATPGGPSNPLPEARLRRKFHDCAGTVTDRETADRVADAIARLDEEGALADVAAAVRL